MRDNIWFTYKARIRAHKRLEWLQFHSQSLLVWYAFLGAALSVVTVRNPDAFGTDTDVLAAILSIALLALSLLVANRDFRGRAIVMRKNYLDLQKLYNSTRTEPSLDHDQYDRLLRECENHREIDDIMARVLAHGEISRPPSNYERAIAIKWVVLSKVVLVTFYLAPIIGASAVLYF